MSLSNSDLGELEMYEDASLLVSNKVPFHQDKMEIQQVDAQSKYDSGITSDSDCRSSTFSEIECEKFSFIESEEDCQKPGTVKQEQISHPNLNPLTRKSKCKSCSFFTYSQAEYWRHLEVHLKGIVLRCQVCPFVTKFRHHFKYHMLRHTGKKPFKCELCNYSAFNKSMLNSHMKSHSNVCKYQCRECPYQAKYAHALRLHMRKHSRSSTDSVSSAKQQTEDRMAQNVSIGSSEIQQPFLQPNAFASFFTYCTMMTYLRKLKEARVEQTEPLDLSISKRSEDE